MCDLTKTAPLFLALPPQRGPGARDAAAQVVGVPELGVVVAVHPLADVGGCSVTRAACCEFGTGKLVLEFTLS